MCGCGKTSTGIRLRRLRVFGGGGESRRKKTGFKKAGEVGCVPGNVAWLLAILGVRPGGFVFVGWGELVFQAPFHEVAKHVEAAGFCAGLAGGFVGR